MSQEGKEKVEVAEEEKAADARRAPSSVVPKRTLLQPKDIKIRVCQWAEKVKSSNSGCILNPHNPAPSGYVRQKSMERKSMDCTATTERGSLSAC